MYTSNSQRSTRPSKRRRPTADILGQTGFRAHVHVLVDGQTPRYEVGGCCALHRLTVTALDTEAASQQFSTRPLLRPLGVLWVLVNLGYLCGLYEGV
jgi:hypothetical protein